MPVVDAWPQQPAVVRAGITAMVEAKEVASHPALRLNEANPVESMAPGAAGQFASSPSPAPKGGGKNTPQRGVGEQALYR
jgi:hypothetical protein